MNLSRLLLSLFDEVNYEYRLAINLIFIVRGKYIFIVIILL